MKFISFWIVTETSVVDLLSNNCRTFSSIKFMWFNDNHNVFKPSPASDLTNCVWKAKVWPISCDEIAIHSLGHTVTGFWALRGLAYLRWAGLRSGTYGLFWGWAKYEHVFKVANEYPLFKYSVYPTNRKLVWILCFLDLHDNWVRFYNFFFFKNSDPHRSRPFCKWMKGGR